MRNRLTWLILATVVLGAACTSSPTKTSASTSGGSALMPGTSPGTYHDPAGWTIDVPAGWHVEPFQTSNGTAAAAGFQVSNVVLPAPSLVAGFPVQTNGKVLPAAGVALIVGTDHDPSDPQHPPTSLPTPPLAHASWDEGSALANRPTFSMLWFSGNGRTYIASLKIGAKAPNADQRAIGAIIGSLRFDSM